MKTYDRELIFEKETKNTYRFKEVEVPGEPQIIGQAYIQKWLITDKDKGVKITIVIPEGEDA
jgi:hypothetical protein